MDEHELALLGPADREAYDQLKALMVEQLGSETAFNIWLGIVPAGWGTTPGTAIRDGRAWLVLQTQREQYGPGFTPA
jgi:hypothetical protein